MTLADSLTVPERLYHCTSPAYREQIRREGLCTRYDRTGYGGVFLSNIPSDSPLDVWEVDTSDLLVDRDWTTDPPDDGLPGQSWWMATEDIPPSRLQLVSPKPTCDPAITFRSVLRGAHHQQKDMTLYIDVDGMYVGHVDYAIYVGAPHVEYIEVPTHKRLGYASRLMRELQRQHADIEIRWGGLTDDGAALFESLPKHIVVRQEVVELRQLLGDQRARRDALIEQCDRFFLLERPTELEKAEFAMAAEPLNGLHDQIFEMERDLAGSRAEVVLLRLGSSDPSEELLLNNGP